jgi:hypothetical protein
VSPTPIRITHAPQRVLPCGLPGTETIQSNPQHVSCIKAQVLRVTQSLLSLMQVVSQCPSCKIFKWSNFAPSWTFSHPLPCPRARPTLTHTSSSSPMPLFAHTLPLVLSFTGMLYLSLSPAHALHAHMCSLILQTYPCLLMPSPSPRQHTCPPLSGLKW